ncbi:MAG: heparan-alpha-glucosaminide N-acetyltransferase [Azospirillaceae bacterium]
MTATVPAATTPGGRLVWLDAARGAAVAAMVAYHLCWDLAFFGLAGFDLTGDPVWLAARTAILSAFLAVAGVSLARASVHAPPRGRRWAIRLAMIGGGAAAISAGTWFAVSERFVWFGVLHHLFVAGLAAPLIARLPATAATGLGLAALVLPEVAATPALDAPWVAWIGLGMAEPATNDWVPVLPWIGVHLLGFAAGRIVFGRRAAEQAANGAGAGGRTDGLLRPLARVGRHSLAVYLLHQPILWGGLWLAVEGTGVLAPERADREAAFLASCERACTDSGADAATCSAYCGCVRDGLAGEGLLDRALADRLGDADSAAVNRVVGRCVARER